jgi:hypothetical protein
MSAGTSTHSHKGEEAMSSEHKRFFYIQRMGPDAPVLDVYGNNPTPGTQVITYPRGKGKHNQHWAFVPAEQRGWWSLRTRMDSELVMTLDPADGTSQSPRIVMQPRKDVDAVRQLWCLVSTEKLGYWFVQSKLIVSNSQNPVVIGVAGGTSDEPNAVTVQLDYLGFETQSWAFAPVHE